MWRIIKIHREGLSPTPSAQSSRHKAALLGTSLSESLCLWSRIRGAPHQPSSVWKYIRDKPGGVLWCQTKTPAASRTVDSGQCLWAQPEKRHFLRETRAGDHRWKLRAVSGVGGEKARGLPLSPGVRWTETVDRSRKGAGDGGHQQEVDLQDKVFAPGEGATGPTLFIY